MSDEPNNHHATGGDALLDRAIDALRNEPVPIGPSPELAARTLTALREARGRELHARRLRPFHRAVRIAAVLALLASAVGVYVFTTQGPRVTVVTPTNATQPAPQTPSPAPAVVQNDAPRRDLSKPPTPKPAPNAPAPPDFVAAASPVGIAGAVLFAGVAPQPKQIDMSAVAECRDRHPQGGLDDTVLVANGRLANVVISIEPFFGQDLPDMASAAGIPAPGPLVLDQHECKFRPRILAGMVGQELVVKNSDPFLHNVHSRASLNPAFNIGQPTVDPGRRLDPLAAPERFQVKCDLHPWMTAYVSVFEHPYFAVSKEDGSFTIPTKGLRDGSYALLAWHEKLGVRRAQVEVKDGKAVAMTEFTFAEGNTAAPSVAPNAVAAAALVKACANCPE